MATLLAHITVKPGAEAAFEAVARRLFDETHAHETGVLRYEYWRGAAPSSYYTLLSFADHRAFITHQTSDHHESASPTIGELVANIRLEWVDPIEGACELPATDMQVLVEDADALTEKYTDRYAAEVADWWLSMR